MVESASFPPPPPFPLHPQMGRGLATLAQHRFVHLDLKPCSILIVCDGPTDDPESHPQAVLANFGLVRRLENEDMVVTLSPGVWSSEQLWGNPAHAAPELQLELQRVGRVGGPARLDYSKQPVFELGVLAYELCAGEYPVPGYPQVLEYDAEDVEEIPAVYPVELVALCRSMVRLVLCGAWLVCASDFTLFEASGLPVRVWACLCARVSPHIPCLQVAADPAARVDLKDAMSTLERLEAVAWARPETGPLRGGDL